MVSRNRRCHTIGADSVGLLAGGKMVSPMPWPLASEVTYKHVGCATSSCSRVGRSCNESASHERLSSVARMCDDTQMRPSNTLRACNAARKWINTPHARSSPSICCHFGWTLGVGLGVCFVRACATTALNDVALTL
jgi:hypothetical protein